MGGRLTTKTGKSAAHEVFAHVGRPGPRAIFMAVPPEAAHGLFAMLSHSKKGPLTKLPPGLPKVLLFQAAPGIFSAPY